MAEKVYGIESIRDLLPYQYPMVLLDRIWSDSEGNFFGLKNVTVTEEFFNGHFPDHPIMPGVLQVEAANQLASIALKDKLDPEGKLDIYIKSMSKIKFRGPVGPGDRLLISLDIKSVENNEASLSFLNTTNSGVSSQGNLVLSSRPREYNIKKPELFTKYDKSDDIIMDVNELKKYMPHRYPFLFIDYIHSVEGTKTTAIKNVTYNDPIMHTYSPGYSVLPATIQSEIIAQAGCAQTLARPENAGKLAFFGTIPKAEFYHPIHPGDQLRIELELPQKISKFGKGSGSIYIEDKKVAYGEVLFAIS
jgi:3-hydroxymyristoyl/3-hydroxydecanoyl-(acyl carrier protein) dehydratase